MRLSEENLLQNLLAVLILKHATRISAEQTSMRTKWSKHIAISIVQEYLLGNIPVTTTTKIFPKVSRYKWEAYCNTNGRRTAIQMGGVLTVFPFPQSVGAPKVLRYKWEAYCNTNGRCIAILFLRSSGGWGF